MSERTDPRRADPAARLLDRIVWRPWLDTTITAGLADLYFPLSRAWAAGLAADGDRERFLEMLPLRRLPPGLDRALARLAGRGRRYREAVAAWEEAAFGPADPGPEVVSMRARGWQRAAFDLTRGRLDMLPVRFGNRPPAVRWQIPDLAAVEAGHGARLADGRAAFSLPSPEAAIEVSRGFTRAGRRELWARFPAETAVVGTAAIAHLYEPLDRADAPTVVYCDGLCVESEFWPDPRDPVALYLRDGFRVLRYEAPWHGRRRPEGWYGGEPVLARAPLSMLDFFQAAVVEAGLWIAWARRRFGGPVTLGGMSLGALTAAKVATICGDWPEAARPDALFLITPGDDLAHIAFAGSLLRRMGLPAALRAHGWAAEDLSRWSSLAEPRGEPAVDPARIVAVLGTADRLTHYADAAAMLRRWRVPQANLLVAERGHFTANLALMTDRRAFARLREVLRRAAVPAG